MINIFKTSIAVMALGLASVSANAGIIEYGEFSQAENSDYSTGLGMDWIRWDVTKGLSIRSALSRYESDGWRMASGLEMSGLFNYFVGSNEWGVSESVSQQASTGFTSDLTPDTETDVQFQKLFGYTYYGASSDYLAGDSLMKTEAFFGIDENGNNKYGLAGLYDDFTVFNGNQNGGNAYLNKDTFTENFAYNRYGVALVRGELDLSYLDADLPSDGSEGGNNGGVNVGGDNGSGNDDGTVSVPEPGTIGMFALAGGFLMMRKRKAA